MTFRCSDLFDNIGLMSADDDFELQAQLDAQRYASSRQLVSDRERIKAENKVLRRQGLPPHVLPKRKGKHTAALEPLELSDASSTDSDGVESTIPRKRWSKTRFEYEGQKVLNHNPLYRLAGITQADPKENRLLRAKERIVPHLRQGPDGMLRNDSPVADSVLSNGRRTDVADSTPPDECVPANHEEVDFVEEGNAAVLVPWGPGYLSPRGAARRQCSVGEDEEGMYSEDEQITDPTSADAINAPGQPMATLTEGGLHPYRPFFTREGDGKPDPLELDRGVTVPAPINGHLRPYQRDGVNFLYNKYRAGVGGVLGDDMGLGKTIQVIAFLAAVMRKSGNADDYQRRKRLIRSMDGSLTPKHWPTALIVCPKSLVKNWERELETWGYFEMREVKGETLAETKRAFNQGFLDILLATYDNVKSSIEELKQMPISIVIADEAHRMKDPRGQLALALKKFRHSSCFALTGTLIQNRLEEMWSVLDFVHRGEAGTLEEWREFVVNPIKKGQRHEGMAKDVVLSILRLGVMHERILPHFSLRRTKRLIAAELPTKRDLVVFCPLAERQVEAYRAFVSSGDVSFVLQRDDPCSCGENKPRKDCCFRTNAEGDTVNEVILRCVSSAIKIANHFGLLYPAADDNEKTLSINRRLYRTCTGVDYDNRQGNAYQAAIDPANCGKWTLLRQLLEEWRSEDVGNKVLIFSNTVRLLKMVDEFIVNNFSGFEHSLLTGEVDSSRRQEMVDDFQDPKQDHFVLLVSTLAGGVGLNLTAANKVVIFDPAWNPANDLQAMDRAFRIGQKRPVDVYRLIGQGTIEENIYERQIQKEQRSRQLNEGTFERRIHQGIDKGRNREEQGELYGVQNLFRFDPRGTVSKNLNRVRLAEDRFLQDMIDAQYAGDGEDGDDDSSDEAGRQMKAERKAKAKRTMLAKSRAKSAHELDNVAGSHAEDEDTAFSALSSLGIQAHDHASAFKDSPEEKQMFSIGLELLASNPELARSIKANDLGRYAGRLQERKTKKPRTSEKVRPDPESEPWVARITAKRRESADGRKLASLSDDE